MNTPADITRFCYELGQLKRLPRAGWHRAGVANPESVAAHSWRVGCIAMVLAHMEGMDAAGAEHAMALGNAHDLPESRIGDVGPVAKPYASLADPATITQDQTARLPASVARHYQSLVSEHESAKTGGTLAARCSRDADKLDCLLQAREYAQSGNQAVHHWMSDAYEALRTSSGRALADEAMRMDPTEWWTNLTVHTDQAHVAG
ncbi:HD domain-containing protein [Saccharopolyspora griseoalba]|uniref:5'-deoxynucleotidase n=1 Tax=Saccharopolyspora griseoalba TaxID=1431848 RepID=A0ABW2LSL4_9PSEU